MNTATLMSETRDDAEERAMEQTRQQMRVAIREIREYAYRALIVAGASPGEATTAAEQVVHAELHAGEGLTGLASALIAGSWPAATLRLTRSGEGTVEVVADLTSVLRLSAVLPDVAAGEEGEANITCRSAVAVTSLWDAALLTACATTGTEVAAIRYDAGAPARVRLASPDGDLVVGHVPLHAVADAARTGVAVRTGATARPSGLEVLARSTATERAARRRRAAQSGLTVDAATWTVVAAHAQQFLVPEVDA